MNDALDTSLTQLMPRRARMIMDLVAEAGIDVTPWSSRLDGTPVSNPKANPKYCYEWAFGGGAQPSVVCVWHSSIAFDKGVIFYADNLRQHALLLDRIAITWENPPHVKSRARDQAARARRFDSLLQRAYRAAHPVRVVLLDGAIRLREELGWERAEVKFRALDGEPWFVHTYEDATGSLRLVRGVVLPESDVLTDGAPPEFVDQFSVPEAPERRPANGSVFTRSAAVRDAVLKRANGLCEYCGEPGFKTESGSIFLETHHVIGLGEDGLDQEWNVVGVCPTDHRRAHYDKEKAEIRRALLALLIGKYPAATHALQKLSAVKV